MKQYICLVKNIYVAAMLAIFVLAGSNQALAQKVKIPNLKMEAFKGGFRVKDIRVVVQPNEDKPGTFIIGVLNSNHSARMFYGSLVPSSNIINLMALQAHEGNNEEVVTTNPVGELKISRQSNSDEYFVDLRFTNGKGNSATQAEYRLKSYDPKMGFDALTNMALYKGSSCIFRKDQNLFDINVEKVANVTLETKNGAFVLKGNFKLSYDFVGIGVLRAITYNKNSVVSEEAKISGFVVLVRDGADLDLVVADTTRNGWSRAYVLPYGK